MSEPPVEPDDELDDEGMGLARDDAEYIEPPLGQDALIAVVEARKAAERDLDPDSLEK